MIVETAVPTKVLGSKHSVDVQFWVQTKNTSLAAPGALANRLQRRTARKANEANLEFPNLKTEITSL